MAQIWLPKHLSMLQIECTRCCTVAALQSKCVQGRYLATLLPATLHHLSIRYPKAQRALRIHSKTNFYTLHKQNRFNLGSLWYKWRVASAGAYSSPAKTKRHQGTTSPHSSARSIYAPNGKPHQCPYHNAWACVCPFARLPTRHARIDPA